MTLTYKLHLHILPLDNLVKIPVIYLSDTSTHHVTTISTQISVPSTIIAAREKYHHTSQIPITAGHEIATIVTMSCNERKARHIFLSSTMAGSKISLLL